MKVTITFTFNGSRAALYSLWEIFVGILLLAKIDDFDMKTDRD